MSRISRRHAMFCTGASALALQAPARAAPAAPAPGNHPRWARGIENQRKADLGNGSFLNPILAGDHPDPSILKDGDDYFITCSSFDTYPGLVIWHSRDLVSWQPWAAALRTNIGSVWAPELCKHDGRYYIYLAAKKPGQNACYVLWANDIRGPWSEPAALGLPRHIDPGHAVGEDGSRWLFLSGGDRVRLAADGLSTQGAVEHVYDPWRYPDDWDVESFSPEGPKLTRHGDYHYLITAIGGTAGPPTGHMVIAARSRSIHGPWEHHPKNPLVRTQQTGEMWWSRGHATLVEGPAGDWWSVYHGYENGFYTLGRQTLLAPVRWTRDGWFEFGGGDLSRPLPKPKAGPAQPHGVAFSDDFRKSEMGLGWHFFDPSPSDYARAQRKDGVLHLRATGSAPKDSSPLLVGVGDRSYAVECDIEIDAGARAGLLLFYDRALYCGLGFDDKNFVTHQYGLERGRPAHGYGRKLRMRLENDRHIVRFHTSADGGKTWKRFDRGMEVSGYHHNVRGGFLMLSPGLYSAGQGEARFSNFTYRAG